MDLRASSIFIFIFMLPEWHAICIASCYPTDIFVIEMKNTITVCEKCMPGYQSSKLCFDHFLTNSCLQLRRDRLEIVYKYYAVEYSDCAACPKGTFVRTYLANQTCLRCSYCMPGDIVESRCTSKSDTLCIPQRNVIGTTNTTYVKATQFPTNQRVDTPLSAVLIPLILIPSLILTMVYVLLTWKIKGKYADCRANQLDVPIEGARDFDFPSFEDISCNDSVYGSDTEKLGIVTLQDSKIFSYEGGTLEITGSSVRMKVPKGAINKEELKDLYAKVRLCRPNDWESLEKSGHTIALPQIELGPNGSQFNKPIEVLMENNTASGEDNDVSFEFTNGRIDDASTWLPAMKCNSREEAKLSALKVAPHVSFYVGDRYLHAFYLHFTGGRKKMKIPKYKWLQSAAYVKTDYLMGGRIAMKVVFSEATEEGKILLSKEVNGFTEVSVTSKPIKVFYEDIDSVTTAIHHTNDSWFLELGEKCQMCSFASMFEPKYLGSLPTVDYIISNRSRGVTDFGCTIDVLIGTEKQHDLKIVVSKEFIEGQIPPKGPPSLQSSGYQSDDYYHDPREQYIIDDSHFKHVEPRDYMMKLIIPLSECMAGYYQQFSRYLGIKECLIETEFKNNQHNATEACYTLLKRWIREQPEVPDFKLIMMKKIEIAIDSTHPPFTVILPDLHHEKHASYETVV